MLVRIGPVHKTRPGTVDMLEAVVRPTASFRACALGSFPLRAPVGGGPPARSPHASLQLGAVDLEARPGPAAAHRR